MNILAFLSERRAKGAGKGKATAKLWRSINQHAKEWADPKANQFTRRLIAQGGGKHEEKRGDTTFTHKDFFEQIDFTRRGADGNDQHVVNIGYNDDGEYYFKEIGGSVVGFAKAQGLSTDEIRHVIDEAERTGYADAQEAMIERLSL